MRVAVLRVGQERHDALPDVFAIDLAVHVLGGHGAERHARPLDVALARQDVRRPDSVSAEIEAALPWMDGRFRVQIQAERGHAFAQPAHYPGRFRLVRQNGDEVVHVARVVLKTHIVLGDVIEAVEQHVRAELASQGANRQAYSSFVAVALDNLTPEPERARIGYRALNLSDQDVVLDAGEVAAESALRT